MKAFRFRERENNEIWLIEEYSLGKAWERLGEEYVYALELQRSVRKKDRSGYARGMIPPPDP